MKLFAVITQEIWVIPNLLVALPALILGFAGVLLLKKKSTNWLFILIAFVIFTAVRLNENDWVVWLQQQL